MILLPIFVSVTNKTKFMPEICRFFGIIIFLYWKDHNPPHIHFTYGDYECSISVLDRIVDGRAPAKVIAKVNEWINLHEAEILSLWEKAQKGEKIDKIEQKINQLKAQKQALLAREKEKERKARTRRLIQIVAIIENMEIDNVELANKFKSYFNNN